MFRVSPEGENTDYHSSPINRTSIHWIVTVCVITSCNRSTKQFMSSESLKTHCRWCRPPYTLESHRWLTQATAAGLRVN